MKRRTTIIGLLGLFLATVSVLGAVGAASASAALPEFVPVGGFPVKFTSTSEKGTLETEKGHKVECASDTNEGEITGPKEDHATIRFKKCKAFGVAPCTSPGAAEGEIVSEVLSELVYVNKTNKEVALLLTPKAGKTALFAEFKCTFIVSATLKVRGAILGTIASSDLNKKIKTTETVSLGFKQKAGIQEPHKYETGEANLETESSGIEEFKFEKSGIETSDALKLSKEGEIKA